MAGVAEHADRLGHDVVEARRGLSEECRTMWVLSAKKCDTREGQRDEYDYNVRDRPGGALHGNSRQGFGGLDRDVAGEREHVEQEDAEQVERGVGERDGERLGLLAASEASSAVMVVPTLAPSVTG